MHPDTIFLHTLDDLASKLIAGPNREYNLLRAAGLLRHLLLDGTTLVSIVNRCRHMKIRYRVPRETLAPPDAHTAMRWNNLLNTPDADAVHVNRDRFIKAVPFADRWVQLTIKHVIDHVAHFGGGIHSYSPSESHDKYLLAVAEMQAADRRVVQIPNLAVIVLGISKIVLTGLQPLRDEIERPVRSSAPKASRARGTR